MINYKYLIVGGGMTAAAAIEGIRGVDKSGSIGLISTESDPPYNRAASIQGTLERHDNLESISWPTTDQGVATPSRAHGPTP